MDSLKANLKELIDSSIILSVLEKIYDESGHNLSPASHKEYNEQLLRLRGRFREAVANGEVA